MKPEDMAHFGKLLQEVNEEELSAEEAKERKIMKLLLKVKNGTPPQRKSALRQLTDKARELGASALFNQVRGAFTCIQYVEFHDSRCAGVPPTPRGS